MKKGDITPLRVKKSLNQKSGSVKTFSIGKLVYVEDFITFDEERGPGPKDKHTHKQTNKHTNIETIYLGHTYKGRRDTIALLTIELFLRSDYKPGLITD